MCVASISEKVPSLKISSKLDLWDNHPNAYIDLTKDKVYSEMTICFRVFFSSLRKDINTVFTMRSSGDVNGEGYFALFRIYEPRHSRTYLGKQVWFY